MIHSVRVCYYQSMANEPGKPPRGQHPPGETCISTSHRRGEQGSNAVDLRENGNLYL